MKNIVYFDLETQKSAEEVGGWGKISAMRMSVGVTYSAARGEYRIYGEKQVDDLLKELQLIREQTQSKERAKPPAEFERKAGGEYFKREP